MSLLTEEEVYEIWNVMEEPSVLTHTRAIEAAVIKKFSNQEPVAEVDKDDDNQWADILPNVSVKVGDKLYLHPKPQSEWQPIETAPKNEVEILVLAPIVGQMVVMFADGYWREKANYLGLKHAPTHWQPLPQPPEAK